MPSFDDVRMTLCPAVSFDTAGSMLTSAGDGQDDSDESERYSEATEDGDCSAEVQYGVYSEFSASSENSKVSEDSDSEESESTVVLTDIEDFLMHS